MITFHSGLNVRWYFYISPRLDCNDKASLEASFLLKRQQLLIFLQVVQYHLIDFN